MVFLHHTKLGIRFGNLASNSCWLLLGCLLLTYASRRAKTMILDKTEDTLEIKSVEYDRISELKAFDDTKAGVKGLVDSGITRVPRIFDCRQFGFNANPQTGHNFRIPIIDFHGNPVDSTWHAEIIDKVGDASKNWGFFHVVNHGIPVSLLDDMINSSRRFHEQDTKVKKEFYTRDMTKKVSYLSNFFLFSTPAANWRDTLSCHVESADPQELPAVCREVLVEYSKQVRKLAHTLLEIFSEALGLKPSYLKDMDIVEELLVLNQYYPPCPEPELTIGTTSHSDGDAVTILLQDNIGGLQILRENQWVDVVPSPGALIVNIGDFLQLISNDKFISANHRVLASRGGPRVSVASFFKPRHEIGNDSQANTMILGKTEDAPENTSNEYDRISELKAFDDTKAGVKGLVDSGIKKVPRIFNCQQFGFTKNTKSKHHISIPIVDLHGSTTDSAWHQEIVDNIQDASRNWGFFQVVNHGVSSSVLDDIICATRLFHEQDTEAKRRFYVRDWNRKVVYLSNFDLFSAPAADWRDTFACYVEETDPEDLPPVYREVLVEYSKQVRQLGYVILELLSEALGLRPSYLKDIKCADELRILGHYYPPCPEPEITMGTTSHSDNDVVTILLQDALGGLQILYEDQWIDVAPLHGGLIVNIGDLLQLISNDKFISATHRVLSSSNGPRISVASFFRPRYFKGNDQQIYRPIPELVSKDNPQVYRHVEYKEYMQHFYAKGLDGTSALTAFKL